MESSEKRGGIYTIGCLATGKVYVGSTKQPAVRWQQHARLLKMGSHFNRYLQHAWNKYGQDQFVYTVIESVSHAALLEREKHHIDRLNSTDPTRGFNIRVWPNSSKGTKLTEEHRARIAASHIGMTHGEDARAKIRAAHLGTKLSDEHKANVSAALKGRVFTDEHRAKLSEANKRRWANPEARSLQAERSRGKKHSPEVKAKMSRDRKGKVAKMESPRRGKLRGGMEGNR